MIGGVDPGEAADTDVADHLAGPDQRLGRRHHRQVAAQEARQAGLVAEGQAADIGVQPVGAHDDVECAWRAMLERHGPVGLDSGDRVAEQILDVVAGGVVIDLAEVVAHDLHVPVRTGRVDLGQVDPAGLGPALAIQRQPGRSGGQVLDAGQDAHLRRDLHGGAEQVDGMAAGLAQRGRALDDGDLEAVTGQPVGQHRAGDAGARDEYPHGHLPDLLNVR